MYKIKIRKSDRVMYDGEFVSNGHWLFRSNLVELSDKELNTLKNAGIKFDRNSGEAQTGEDIRLPDMKSHTEKPSTTKLHKLMITDEAIRLHGKDRDFAVMLESIEDSPTSYNVPDGELKLHINFEYVKIIEGIRDEFSCDIYGTSPNDKVFLIANEDVIGLVMPMKVK